MYDGIKKEFNGTRFSFLATAYYIGVLDFCGQSNLTGRCHHSENFSGDVQIATFLFTIFFLISSCKILMIFF